MPSPSARGAHVDLAALGELDRVRDEVAQHLREPLLVGAQRGQVRRLVEHQRDGVGREQRAEHAAQSREQLATVNSDGRMVVRPASILATSSRSFTISVSDSTDLRMMTTCRSCSPVRSPSSRSRQEARHVEHGRERRAQLVADVGEEARLVRRRALEVLRAVVELRVQREHAAVGLLQLRVQPLHLGLSRTQLLQGASSSWFCCCTLLKRAARRVAHEHLGDAGGVARAHGRGAAGQRARDLHRGAAARSLSMRKRSPGAAHR
jgi:hypothetical protein